MRNTYRKSYIRFHLNLHKLYSLYFLGLHNIHNFENNLINLLIKSSFKVFQKNFKCKAKKASTLAYLHMLD